MIVKKLKRISFKKPKATMIGGLVDYILAEHDDRGKNKLAYAGKQKFSDNDRRRTEKGK